MSFLDDYEPVADRIDKFWSEHAAGKILTDLVFQDERRFVVKAWIWRGPVTKPILIPDGATFVELPIDRTSPDATGYAEEIVGSGNVNRTSALENCETSAIGRALANLGYASKAQRASREEMAKVAGRDELEEQVTEYAREAVKQFERWPVLTRADEYKKTSKAVLKGKPSTIEEVDRVIRAMTVTYEATAPFEDANV